LLRGTIVLGSEANQVGYLEGLIPILYILIYLIVFL